MTKCKHCKGVGYDRVGKYIDYLTSCPECNGKGYFKKICIECIEKPVCANSDFFCKDCNEAHYKNIEPSPWF